LGNGVARSSSVDSMLGGPIDFGLFGLGPSEWEWLLPNERDLEGTDRMS